MILRYVPVKITQRVGMGVHHYSKLCITDGKWEGEEGDEESCWTMTLDEFNKHDWDEPIYDDDGTDVVATLMYEMPPKLKAHYDECCEGNLEYEDGDYGNECEIHFCTNCEMRYNIPTELVRDYDSIMPETYQYEHDQPDGMTAHAFLNQLVQKDLY
jgi:hypothetical protein